MAKLSDKDIKDIRNRMKRRKKERDPKVLEETIKLATGDKRGMEAFKAEAEIRRQWRIATEKTTSFKTGLLKGIFGEEAGGILAKQFAKASTEEVAAAEAVFEPARKETDAERKERKVAVKKMASATKDIPTLKNSLMRIEKNMLSIQRSLLGKTSPSVKEGYKFDPRMVGGGRFVNVETGKIVSKREAVSAERSAALGAAIAADEDPLIRLANTVDEILNSIGTDNKSIHKKLDELADDIQNIDTGGGISDMLDNIDIGRTRTRTRPTRKPGRFRRGLRRIGVKALRALRYARAAAPAAAIGAAAVGSVALVTGGAAYMASGKAADAAKEPMKELERVYGLKVIYDSKGATVGYIVNGKKYGLNDLPQEYKDLIDAYGPGDKRNATARAAIARIKANPEIYNALKLSAKATGPAPAPPPISTAPTPAPTAGPISRAVAAAKATVQRAAGAGAQATMATGAAVGAGGAAVAAGVKTSVDKVKDIIVDAAKKVGVNPGIMLAMGQQESSFNPSAQPYDKKTGKLLSSAKGIFQFINSTWDTMVKKYSGSYPELLKGAFDPVANAIAGALYVKENSKYLQKKGIPVDGTSIYATHFLGPGGAAKLFSAPKDAIAADVMPAAAKSNPHIFIDKKTGQSKTVQQVIDTLYKKVGSKAEEFQAQVNSGKIGGSVPASISGAEPQPMLASAAPAATSDPLAVTNTETKGGVDLDGKPLVAATPKPVPSKVGAEATQQSKQYASNQMVAQATPAAPVVINNNNATQQPVQAPKQPLPSASSRSSESSFNRALAKDFSHPTSFTSVAPV